MKTFAVTPSDIERKWWIIDATDVVLGRMSAEVSKLLRGKHKPYYSTNLDCGDYVVIINADKVRLTGNKINQKKYYWHTGFPGGIKERSASKVIAGKFPERVIRKAIERMISRSPMGRTQMKKLFVYGGSEHPHQAQTPENFDIAAKNSKNKRTNKG